MMLALKLIALAIVTVVSILLVRTNQLLWTKDQANFTTGLPTTSLPDGTYAGKIAGPPVSWLGKKFDAAQHTGINLFRTSTGSTTENYPFTLSIAPGTHDNRTVVDVDYNLASNPFWLRPVLDELVETGPDTYLGKLQLRIIPGYPFTLTYFTLQKKNQ